MGGGKWLEGYDTARIGVGEMRLFIGILMIFCVLQFLYFALIKFF